MRSTTDAVDKFVVCEGRCAGNTAQLQQMVKEENGVPGSRDTLLRCEVPIVAQSESSDGLIDGAIWVIGEM